MKGLKDKVVIVTGGASGIGLATVERLVSEGSKVAIVDVNGQRASAAATAIGGGTIGMAGDVSSEADVQRYFAEIKHHFGHIDALHNNAGVGGSLSLLVDLDLATIERMIAVNYLGIFLNLREMLRVARDAGTRATIVNTASLTAGQPAPMMGAYASTKAAVISLTLTAAFETARTGTRVNAVMPGPIETAMLEPLSEEYHAAMRAAVPVGRMGKPEEVAAMAAFLLSDEAPFATGGVYPVDGGAPRAQPQA